MTKTDDRKAAGPDARSWVGVHVAITLGRIDQAFSCSM